MGLRAMRGLLAGRPVNISCGLLSVIEIMPRYERHVLALGAGAGEKKSKKSAGT